MGRIRCTPLNSHTVQHQISWIPMIWYTRPRRVHNPFGPCKKPTRLRYDTQTQFNMQNQRRRLRCINCPWTATDGLSFLSSTLLIFSTSRWGQVGGGFILLSAVQATRNLQIEPQWPTFSTSTSRDYKLQPESHLKPFASYLFLHHHTILWYRMDQQLYAHQCRPFAFLVDALHFQEIERNSVHWNHLHCEATFFSLYFLFAFCE